MGEDEWTHREPGSATGSVVPPPAIPEQSAAAPPHLPDNVRYLFKPLLTQTALAVEPANTDVEPNAETRSASRTSAGNEGAPAADKPSQPGERPRRPSTAATVGSHRRVAAVEAGRHRARPIARVAAVLVVVSTAVGTSFALARHGPTANSANRRSAGAQRSTRGVGGRTLPGFSSVAIVRAQGARWGAHEISKR